MANSDAEGLIYFSTSDYGTDQPHDALNARCAMNNAEHLADMCGQVRVAWSLQDGGSGITNTEESTATSPWHVMARFGPFPLTLDSDGLPYPLRVAIGGISTQAATQVKMRVVVSPPAVARRELNRNGNNVAEAETSSLVAAWLATTVGGTTGTLLTFSRDLVDAAYVSSYETVDAIGGSPIAIETFEWWATVFGQNTGASEVEPVLAALYLAEYVGT